MHFSLFHLINGVIFPEFGKNYQISALGCLESAANKKGVYLAKKATRKKNSTRKINVQLAKFSF